MRAITHAPAAAAVAAVLALGIAGCAPPAEEDEGEKSITIAVSGLNVNYDPFAGGVNGWASFNMEGAYDTLWYRDQVTNTYEPQLAAEWSLSEDKQTLTMKLRDDVEFLDGVHLDAAGLESYYDAYFADADGGGWIVTGWGVEATALSEYEIEITGTKPLDDRFFNLISLTGIASPGSVGKADYFADGPVGSGPYLIEDTEADVSLTMVRNPDYWNPEAYPYDRVVLKVFADEVAALNALKSGQVDVAKLGIPLAIEAEASGLTVHHGAGTFRHLYIGDVNGAINPALGDVRVREAINYAFDRETIAETLDLGFGNSSSQPFTPGQNEYLDGEDDRYAYDPDKARELLAEAGYPDGIDLTIANTPITDDVEPLVAQALGDVGIRVEYLDYTWEQWSTEFLPALQGGQIPVLLFSDYFINTTSNYMKPDGVFHAWPVDPKLTELIATIAGGTDEESRAASQELGEFILDEAMVVTFSKPSVTWASIPEVDVEPGPIHGQPLLRAITPAS